MGSALSASRVAELQCRDLVLSAVVPALCCRNSQDCGVAGRETIREIPRENFRINPDLTTDITDNTDGRKIFTDIRDIRVIRGSVFSRLRHCAFDVQIDSTWNRSEIRV